MYAQSPGTPDYDYGTQGVANIPPEPGYNPDVASLQVGPSTLDAKGRVVVFGRNPADSSPGLLTRLNADGHWDVSTGHVVVEADDLPDETLDFRGIVGATINGQQTYFAVGLPTYFDANFEQYLNFIGVSRFDEYFKPVTSFGDNGHALPDPGEGWQTGDEGRAKMRRVEDSTKALLSSSERPLAFANGSLRAIFPYTVGDEYDEHTESWLAVFNPETGELVHELGEARDLGMLPLTDNAGFSLRVLRAHFFADGSFLVLAESTNQRVIVRRYDRHGIADERFNDGQGQRDLFAVQASMRLGIFSRNGRIAVSRGEEYQLQQPTTVFVLAESGANDPTFNRGQPLTLGSDGHGLALGEIYIDDQDRIVLGGALLTATNVGRLQVYRLTRSGELDSAFGNGGLFDGGPDFRTANKVFASGHGIHILTLTPTRGSYFLERVLKLHD
ncbi:hypothetical protein IAE33_000846 [Pseudomonas sp. S60]|uniref:hypothetical protein n=1 Tax=Pseudomonas sp. S60 TaxID=211124 RepID=UPI0019139F8A|nr:hypothetical protein [Pseudomonas sp. S60]MBK5008986.1 hypothetical protein [Pseudomonas sp. S60]